MFKIFAEGQNIQVVDQKTGKECTFFNVSGRDQFLLFTDGTYVYFEIKTGLLKIYHKGPCYIAHDDKVLFYGKTHLEFLMADYPNSLESKLWP